MEVKLTSKCPDKGTLNREAFFALDEGFFLAAVRDRSMGMVEVIDPLSTRGEQWERIVYCGFDGAFFMVFSSEADLQEWLRCQASKEPGINLTLTLNHDAD